MSILAERLRVLRKQHKLTQKDVACFLGISESGYGYYEQGRNEPSLENLNKLARKYVVSVSYLTGENEENTPLLSLTEKDEHDIKIELERIIHSLDNKNGLASFNGQTLDDMDEEDRELLISSLENSMRLAKRMAKQKFTPEKYKKDSDAHA